MADIKQAAKWIQEGKDARRRAWHPNVPAWTLEDDAMTDEEWTSITQRHDGKHNMKCDLLCIGDLLADDWELPE